MQSLDLFSNLRSRNTLAFDIVSDLRNCYILLCCEMEENYDQSNLFGRLSDCELEVSFD